MGYYFVRQAVLTGLCATVATSAISTDLATCLTEANIPVSLPSSSDFSQLSQPYNLRLHYTPAVIVSPITTQQVSSAVLCAARSKTKVQARSGGHS